MYHGTMSEVATPAAQRLALLLAGAGVRCRRALASLEPAGSSFDALARHGFPGDLLADGRRALVEKVPRVLDRIASAGWRWLAPGDQEWPRRLAATADPPLGLFVRGRLTEAHATAVVGSRRATEYGRHVGRLLAEELARAGVVVVSGMARGVDAAAHHGALSAGGPTVAVWGAGPDRVYPPEHRELAEAIAEAGALVTEFPPGAPPRPHHFPQRNRILAGLADAVVVVEAAARSGALLTARLALDEGREVLAVPGSVLSPVSVGPNALLRMGAAPALGARDVLDALGCPEPPELRRPTPPPGLLDVLQAGESVAVDDLAARADSGIAAVLGELLELEMGGWVERRPDGRYSRR